MVRRTLQTTLVVVLSLACAEEKVQSPFQLFDLMPVTPTFLTTDCVADLNGQVTFTVALEDEPLDTVTVSMSSTELTFNPEQLTFTAQNHRLPQAVVIALAAGVAEAPSYTVDLLLEESGLSGQTILNTCFERGTVTVNPVSGLVTSEQGGSANFTVVLDSLPVAAVQIPIASSNTNEGTLAATELVFTSDDWSTPQTVIVNGANDGDQDGDITYTVALDAIVSDDPKYNGVDPADVELVNTDNDTPGITVSPTSGLVVSEPSTGKTFTVVLDSEISANVTIGPFVISDATEATVTPSGLTFTTAPGDWSTPRVVSIAVIDDALVDGNQSFTIDLGSASGTADYVPIDPGQVTGYAVDDESPQVIFASSTANTSEPSTTGTFAMRLNREPIANVTIPSMNILDTTEGTSVNPTGLTFTPANWTAYQTVTITPADDLMDDGNVTYTINFANTQSVGNPFDNVSVTPLVVINADDDTAAFIVNNTDSTTSEDGTDKGTFTVRLQTEPLPGETITLREIQGTVPTEGDLFAPIAPLTMSFTSANWNTNQTVTVAAFNDAYADGTQTFTIDMGTGGDNQGGTTGYFELAPTDLTFTSTDNDTAGILVTPTSGLTVSENFTVATFTVVLTSRPKSGEIVRIDITSLDTTEGTVNPSVFDFQNNPSTDWSTPRTVSIIGVDDALADGNVNFTVRVSINGATTATEYLPILPIDVQAVNQSNE